MEQVLLSYEPWIMAAVEFVIPVNASGNGGFIKNSIYNGDKIWYL